MNRKLPLPALPEGYEWRLSEPLAIMTEDEFGDEIVCVQLGGTEPDELTILGKEACDESTVPAGVLLAYIRAVGKDPEFEAMKEKLKAAERIAIVSVVADELFVSHPDPADEGEPPEDEPLDERLYREMRIAIKAYRSYMPEYISLDEVLNGAPSDAPAKP